MQFPPLAPVSSLVTRLARVLSPIDSARAEAVLADVSTEVRAETGRTWCLDTGELDPTRPNILEVVTLRAAERAVRNPANLAGESLGDYRRTFAEADHPAGGTYLTEGERRLLALAVGAAGVVSVPVEHGDVLVSDTVWLADQYNGDAIPWRAETDP